jgi:lipoprotein
MKKFIFILIVCAGIATMVSCDHCNVKCGNNVKDSDTVKVDSLDSASVDSADSAAVTDSTVCND